MKTEKGRDEQRKITAEMSQPLPWPRNKTEQRMTDAIIRAHLRAVLLEHKYLARFGKGALVEETEP